MLPVCQYAVQCGNLIWPELPQAAAAEVDDNDQDDEMGNKISWYVVENRPFLRAYSGLALSLQEQGSIDAAMENYKFLLDVNPSDNQGCRELLFQLLVQTGRFQEAEDIAGKYSNTRDNCEDCTFSYGFVLIDFQAQSDKLETTLVKALGVNNLVPVLLLEQHPLPPRPSSVRPGSMSEAASYVHSALATWKRIPGALDWLAQLQVRGGEKPQDDGTILFKLLRKGALLIDVIDFTGRRQTKKTMEVTLRLKKMSGTGLPDFVLPPGMKDHDPAKIVCYATENETQDGDMGYFETLSYEHVTKVHFWDLLRHHGKLVNDRDHHCRNCFKVAQLCCTRCKYAWYCSPECQRKDWKHGSLVPHKIMCPKYIKT